MPEAPVVVQPQGSLAVAAGLADIPLRYQGVGCWLLVAVVVVEVRRMAEAATVMVVVEGLMMIVARTTMVEVVVEADVEVEMSILPVPILVRNCLAPTDLEGSPVV